MLKYITEHTDLLKKTLEELVLIPAPSHYERKRSEYCIEWIRKHIGVEAFQQECGNVILAYPTWDPTRSYTVFMAHLDTVFPIDTALELKQDAERWSCPGIGDDTANAAVLLLLAKYVFETGGNGNFLFVFDVGEEGLGNLKGVRALIDAYQASCRQVISFDLYYPQLYTSCVGSIRYEICIRTRGGHSYFDFGTENAIAVMSDLIGRIYSSNLFALEGLTYNAGTIQGGTSVNTIAPDCSLRFEFRSTKRSSLEQAKKMFDDLLNQLRDETDSHTEISCTVLGERPCAQMEEIRGIEMLADLCEKAVYEASGIIPERGAASTDCNYPLSKGIPAVCVGLVLGGGAHTKEEWIFPESLEKGLEIGIYITDHLTQNG